MGSCGCDCQKRENTQYEMFEGSLPEKKSSTEEDTKNQHEVIFIPERVMNENKLKKNYLNQIITLETEFVSKNQERNEFIFDFFNQLRLNPEKFINESKKYELSELIQNVIDNNLHINNCCLIKNPFMYIFLEEVINKTNGNKDEIMNKLTEESRIRNYDKQLYIVKTSENDPKETIWLLLKENKNIALKEFFKKKMDYFVVSSQLNDEKHSIVAYFLILKRKSL